METNVSFLSKPRKSCCLGKLIWETIVYLFRTMVLVILIVVLAPPIYFAWRAGQPMELPEFGGKTFYKIQAERQQEYSLHEAYWQLTHHGEYPMHSKGMCYRMEIGFILVVVKPLMDIALIRHMITPNDPIAALPANVYYHDILDYLPASWTLFEMGALNLYQYIPYDVDAARGPHHGACIIPPPNGSQTAK